MEYLHTDTQVYAHPLTRVTMGKREEKLRSKAIKTFWVTLTVGIAIFTLFVSIRTVGDMIETNRRRSEMEQHIGELEAKIARDSMFIKQLTTSPEFLESFAREQYHMQRQGETVYILEE